MEKSGIKPPTPPPLFFFFNFFQLRRWFSHHALGTVRLSCPRKWRNRCRFSEGGPVLITSPSEAEIVRGEGGHSDEANSPDPARKTPRAPRESKKKKTQGNSRNSHLEMMETSPPSCVSMWRHLRPSISVCSLVSYGEGGGAAARTKVPTWSHEDNERARNGKKNGTARPASLFPKILVFIIRPALERGLRWRSGVVRMGFCG